MENAWNKHWDNKIRPRSAKGGNENALSCLFQSAPGLFCDLYCLFVS